MITRRSAVAIALSSALVPLAASSQAESGDQAGALRMLIESVVQGGQVSLLPDIVAEDARLPDYDVQGLDMFTTISSSNHLQRQADFTTYEFQIEAICEVERWALAYVRFIAETISGDEVDTPAFYAVHFNTVGLVDEVYIG
ncbi:MAG TPA: hypothetical protein VEW66_01790 [Thermomicrobiales bacterium]|nr:hypothetical protein [Thermomicrobiales bacterium]